jgi:FAD/FMN-containing dehydrogenase
MAAYLTDWRGRYTGNALAVLKPANTNEVAECVKLCLETKTPIVPQGGNTGLVLGSVPDQTGHAVVLSLSRLNKIQSIDIQNNTITVDAGCLLQQVQEYAAHINACFLFL